MPVNFMKADAWNGSIDKIVDLRLIKTTSQPEIDGLYEYVCYTLYSEMDQYLKILNMGPQSKRRWNNNLAELRKTPKIKEHEYTKSKKNLINRNICCEEFKVARHEFDKILRKYERNYYQDKALNIENLNKNNPREFWDAIRKLGPRKKTSMTM